MCRHLTIGEALLVALCTLGATSTDAEVPKRAPSGFMGMRGKKQGSEELVYEDFEKRAPGMGFQGVRGKKDEDASLFLDEPDYYEKRAPGMGFQGVRGKKNDGSDLFEDLNKRAPGIGFQGVRGKKDQNLLEDPGFLEKRAPGSGFQGVRGKKNSMDDYKRAPSMGFQGVRGKKDQNNLDDEESEANDGYKLGLAQTDDNKYEEVYNMPDMEDIWGEGFDKRAPSGFFGMRGKKAPSGFMGMRGKKAPSGFMGMRGKKAPSGFMGMRGKKGDDMDLESFLEALEAEELRDQAALRHLEADQSAGIKTVREKRYRMKSNTKKAPSGFMGMRGKKWDAGPGSRAPQVADLL